MRQVPVLAFLSAAIIAVAGSASAQSRAQLIEAFSGEWFVFDPGFHSAAEPCALTLTATETGRDGRLEGASGNCSGALADLTSWSIEGGVLRLFDAAENQTAELGGNQRRVTGTTLKDQRGLVVERAKGDGTSETLALAVQRHRCYFVGLTPVCAGPGDLALPIFTPEGDRMLAEIEIFGNLVVRGQPRRDATQIGTIPDGACIRVNQCLVASDGLWCRAAFGDTQGWLAKTALRREEWPIVTYKSGCSAVAD
ncbi:hypothetical protein [Szabonella alba]|uniref:SH3 domain-containing protein n=1 Tax=Szabonella alba TaxID=2804194 RepID=A0A8K0VGC8_9RHOB|nr:hypothetical protein [Szabonella alba]MBL4918882.1 hypothetical protein [Szabonella alba]